MVKFVGTRTDEFGKFSFEEALFTPGYLPDGGLLVPETVPQISKTTLLEWSRLSYVDLCKRIFPLFVSEDEIPEEDINGIVDRAVAKLNLPEVLKLARLSNGLNILEMFHTRTLSFKDVTLVTVGQFMEYFVARRKRRVTLIVGTSGDTGSAAIEAVRGLDNIDIVLLVPTGCSKLQQQSMYTAIDKNVHIFSATGTSDDIDIPVKKVCTDAPFKERHSLGTVNSINWARVMAQMVHFFFAYFAVCPACDEEVEMVVPTGACGNMTAACFARHMGLPIKIVCAVNSNDIVHRTISSNDYSMANEVVSTLSPAIDIQIPYNIERVFWLFSNGNTSLVNAILTKFESDNKADVDPELLRKIQNVVSSYAANNAIVIASMQQCWQKDSYLLCPHSAVAVSHYYHRMSNEDENKRPTRVYLATASPEKFPEALTAANLTPVPSKQVDQWRTMPTRYTEMPLGADWVKMLRDRVEKITAAREAGCKGDLYESGHLKINDNL